MRLFVTTALAALAMATAAAAQTAPAEAPKAAKPAPKPASGQYIAVSGGLIGKTDYDYSFAGGYTAKADVDAGAQGAVAWGSTLGGNWRAEIALGYRSQKSDTTVSYGGAALGDTKGHVKALSVDINAYYDFPVNGPVKPYLGGGLGVAQVKFSDELIDDKGDALTLQGIAGASFAVSPSVSLFAEGRLQYTGSIKIKTTSPYGEKNEHLNMTGGGLLVGARFAF